MVTNACEPVCCQDKSLCQLSPNSAHGGGHSKAQNPVNSAHQGLCLV